MGYYTYRIASRYLTFAEKFVACRILGTEMSWVVRGVEGGRGWIVAFHGRRQISGLLGGV